MKIAISATAEGWDAAVDERFGRARYFSIVTIEGDSREIESIPNTQNLQAAQGAGIQAAQNVIGTGATKLLTGHVGPKAFKVLAAGEVEIHTVDGVTVKEAVEDLLAGKYNAVQSADVEGHW